MKESVKRLTTGFILMAVFITMLVIDKPIVDTIIIALLSFVGIYEYNKCFKNKGYHPIPFVGYIGCLGLFLIGAGINFVVKMNIIGIAIPILLVYMFAYIVIKKLEVNIVDVAITVLSLIYVPFLFAFVKLLFMQPGGRILAILAFTSAIATDTFAYEIGSRFGKHKLSPVVSPKKSIEGSVAGILGSMICCGVLAYITNTYFATEFNIILVALMGILFSVVGQIGDLAASSIKRYCGQKDFSTLLPGHGGVLDRFDSVMFIAPMVYAFMYIVSLF